MEIKFHINNDFVVAICHADRNRCHFGNENEHFSNKSDAEDKRDEIMKAKYGILPIIITT